MDKKSIGVKKQCTTPYKIYAQIGISTKPSNINKNRMAMINSPILKSHKC